MIDRSAVSERLQQYDKNGIAGQWHIDGSTPDAAWLGGGNFGCVYGVYRERTDAAGQTVRQQAALKVVPIDEQTLGLSADGSREARQEALRDERRKAERERDALQRIKSGAHVAHIFDSDIVRRDDTELDSWDLLIVMDRLTDLKTAFRAKGLRSGTRPYLAEVLKIWRHISDGLSTCQEHGVINADVKPDNILYTPGPDGQGDYLLCDFGTAIIGKTFGDLFFGTEDYMSPEMYAHRGGDILSDMYSLGVVVYELLNDGRIPFQQGADRVAAYRRRLEEGAPIPRLKGIPEDVNDVLARCLETEPGKRYPTFRELEQTVRGLLMKYTGQAPRRTGHVPRPGRSPRLALIAGAAAVVIAVAVAVIGRSGGDGGGNDAAILNPEQEIHTLEDLDGTWVGADERISVSGSARADATLDVTINGTHLGYFPADSAGVFEVEIPSRHLDEGENNIAVSYYTQGESAPGETVSEVTVYCDTQPPEIDVPEEIDQYTEALDVSVSDGDPACSVALLVDGALVEKTTVQEGAVVLEDIQTLGLTGESAIEVVAVDRANNTVRKAIAFHWQPGGIAVTEPAGTLFNETVRHIAGTAEPDTALAVSCGGESYAVRAGGDGSFALDIQSDWMQQGENLVTIGYTEIKGLPVEGEDAKQITLHLTYDSQPPQLSVEPTQIVAGERDLQIRLEEEDTYQIGLLIDGAFVVPLEEMTVGGGSILEMSIPGDIPLTKTSQIAVAAYDQAGNEAQAAVQYVSVDSIAVTNTEELAHTSVGTARTVTMNGTAEANALLDVTSAVGTYSVQTDGSGQFSLEITADMLRSGDNTLYLSYGSDNDFPERALGGTEAEASVYRDGEMPEVTVSEQTLTRDTTELTVTVANEPIGYGVRLTVAGEVVWTADDVQTRSVTVDGLRDLHLREDSAIVLSVTDYVNEPTELALTYENTSVVAEALAWSDTEDLGGAAAGETLPLQAWALCSGYDMREGYVTMRLAGEAGVVMDNCRFTREEASAEQFAQLSQDRGIDAVYVDSLFAVTGVTVPEDCPSGTYRLEIVFSTENDSYIYPLGTLAVEGQAQDGADGRHYINQEENYAIGLDDPLQDVFPADGVVLTGWVYHSEGAQPYFDRGEIIDAAGRVSATVYFADEVTLYPRWDVQSLVGELPDGEGAGLTGGTEEEAGFVMRLDLSGQNLPDGTYTLQLYSSNRTGEDAWETVRTTLVLQSGAAAVTDEALAALMTGWEPPETPEETAVPE